MDFNNEIKTIGKDIYEKVSAFVEANKGSDPDFYNVAILNLSDGRKMFFSFDSHGWLRIFNFEWNDELDKGSGEEFNISAKSTYGFLVNINILTLDKDYLSFTVADDNHQFQGELSDENKNIIKNYMTKLQEQIQTLEYDKEATCSIENMNFKARKEYKIQKFNDEVKKMLEEDPTSRALPSVQTAVDWWVEKLTAAKNGQNYSKMFGPLAKDLILQNSINDIQLDKFKNLLSQAIMNKLEQGNAVELSTDYSINGILRDALEGAKISLQETPYKPIMNVDVDSVRVAVSYQDKFEEIFNNSVEEELKHKM